MSNRSQYSRAGRIERRFDPVGHDCISKDLSLSSDFRLRSLTPPGGVDPRPGSILNLSSECGRVQERIFQDAVEDYADSIKRLIKMADSL